MPRPTTYRPTISLCLTDLRLANLRLDMTGDCAYHNNGGGFMRKKYISCSFCGKRQDFVYAIICGKGEAAICDECVALCQQIVDEKVERDAQRNVEKDSERGE